MRVLSDAAKTALRAGRLAYLVTVEPDGSPQVSIVWVGIDGEESCAPVSAGPQGNATSPATRASVSVEAEGANAIGLDDYLIVYGSARLTAGGGPSCCSGLPRSTSARA